MHAITPAEIADWIDYEAAARKEIDAAMEASWWENFGRHEQAALAALPASKRFDYFCNYEGSLAEICPACGTRYVEVDDWSFPDMVGDTSGRTYECCGHTESSNSAIEYRNGVAVDMR
jgi:hypothetical protein